MNQSTQQHTKKVLSILQENSQFITSISGMGYNCVNETDWNKVAKEIAEYMKKEVDQIVSDINREEGTNIS